VQDGGCGGVSGGKFLSAAGKGAAGLADDAGGAGEREIELEDESAAGVLVEEVGGCRFGGGQVLVDEDEGEVVAADEGEGGAAVGSGVDFGVEI